ncbi:MAG: NAD-dependent DNA ligase LigA, partial [Defluviitaleaceae bacterium]|nr:NAD-dependent DNA ligase LigA [Defluviitaleaceae bacterium]
MNAPDDYLKIKNGGPVTARMLDMIERLNEAAFAYYQENREIISDREYDALYDLLVSLEESEGVRLSGSPTVKVGYETVGLLSKVAHESAMLSLDKTKEISKLADFLNDMPGILSWKLDGLTLALRYEGGELRQALTRGNGTVGEDVTHNARVFKNIPLFVPYRSKFTVRGEAVISYADFKRINDSAPEFAASYKNPRNLCSGTVRQLSSEIAASRSVRFYAFAIVGASGGEGPPADFRSNQLEWLNAQGFETVWHIKVNSSDVAEVVNQFEEAAPDYGIATDGLVLAYNDIGYGESLGATSKFPKDSIAFKWADELAETKIISIEWNTSRTGLINPVAVFEPVEIEGSTVGRA